MEERNEVNLTTEEVEENLKFYDPDAAQIELDGLATVSKEVTKSIVKLSDAQIRIILDGYYQVQGYRIILQNQIRAVKQGYDSTDDYKLEAIEWLLADAVNRENQYKKLIAAYTKNVSVCRWATAIKGIGPVFAAILLSYIDMSKCRHANQFLSYAGLNDNNTPWLGKEKATELVNEAYKEFGLKNSDSANEDVFQYIGERTGRTLHKVKTAFKRHKEKDTHKSTDKTILIKYLSMPPYNMELKKLCFLIGESFVKVSNRGSLYGEIYKERKAWETSMNEKGHYAEQAAQLLEEFNYSKDTDTYKCLIQGKLSPAHINMRAKRYAVKIFLTHFFEACWTYHYKTKPPVIYPIAFLDHVDYIEPEVPYSDYITYKNE